MNAVPVDLMDAETFARNRAVIEHAISTLPRNDPLRKRMRLLEVHADSNALVAEVLRTAYGAVVVTFRVRGGVLGIEPVTGDPGQEVTVDGDFSPLPVPKLIARIANGAKRLKLLRPTVENQNRLVLGYRPDDDPEVIAKSQISRLRGAVRTRREQGHDAAQIAGTEEYLAQAQADLVEIKQRSRRGRR